MKSMTVLLVILAAQWWLLSGMSEPLLLALGMLSVLLTAALAWRMRIVDSESIPLQLGWPLPRFWLRLMRDIVISNLQVVTAIFSPRRHLRPRMIEVRLRQRSALGRVIVANAITLTPGTVTVELHDRRVLVHALSEASAAGVLAGDFDDLVPGERDEAQP